MSINKVLFLLEEISDNCIAGNVANRLIMTDDIRSLRALRDIAMAGDSFFFGCALTDEVQAKVDSICREYKEDMLALLGRIPEGEDQEHCPFIHTWDNEQNAHLIKLKRSGVGFYITPRKITPREERRARFKASQEVEKGQSPSTRIPVAKLRGESEVSFAAARYKDHEVEPAADVIATINKAIAILKEDDKGTATHLPPVASRKKQKKAPVKRKKFVTLREIRS